MVSPGWCFSPSFSRSCRFFIDPLTSPCLTDTFLSFSLPSFLVIIPAIAQRLVDDAAIPIKFAQVLQPTPDSITFSLSASLKVPLGLSVAIDPLDLSLFNREVKPMKPYITAPLGRIRLKGESAITVSNQTTKIQDQDEFIKFLSKAVYSKRFTLSAYGKTTAHLGKLKVPLTLDKDIELDGMHIQKFPVLPCSPYLWLLKLWQRRSRSAQWLLPRLGKSRHPPQRRRFESGWRGDHSKPLTRHFRPGKATYLLPPY